MEEGINKKHAVCEHEKIDRSRVQPLFQPDSRLNTAKPFINAHQININICKANAENSDEQYQIVIDQGNDQVREILDCDKTEHLKNIA